MRKRGASAEGKGASAKGRGKRAIAKGDDSQPSLTVIAKGDDSQPSLTYGRFSQLTHWALREGYDSKVSWFSELCENVLRYELEPRLYSVAALPDRPVVFHRTERFVPDALQIEWLDIRLDGAIVVKCHTEMVILKEWSNPTVINHPHKSHGAACFTPAGDIIFAESHDSGQQFYARKAASTRWGKLPFSRDVQASALGVLAIDEDRFIITTGENLYVANRNTYLIHDIEIDTSHPESQMRAHFNPVLKEVVVLIFPSVSAGVIAAHAHFFTPKFELIRQWSTEQYAASDISHAIDAHSNVLLAIDNSSLVLLAAADGHTVRHTRSKFFDQPPDSHHPLSIAVDHDGHILTAFRNDIWMIV
jgi:hypothetical protein